MQELLFRRQPEWGEIHGHGPQVAAAAARREPTPVLLERYAAELGLDVARVRAAVAENRYAAKVERDMKDGQSLGVNKTITNRTAGVARPVVDIRWTRTATFSGRAPPPTRCARHVRGGLSLLRRTGGRPFWKRRALP